jgi:hypothetical protein
MRHTSTQKGVQSYRLFKASHAERAETPQEAKMMKMPVPGGSCSSRKIWGVAISWIDFVALAKK